jgi:hypothetical protein
MANGYYGGKVRTPGERFGIDSADGFSIEWMKSDDPKVIANIRARAKEQVPEDATRDERRGVEARVLRYRDWLKADHDEDDDTLETRRVNVGGTDGVVGVEVPKAGAKVSAKDRKALAEAATGRKPKSTADADVTLAAVAGASGSDNDDRSRDMAIDQTQNAPAPDWEKPVQADD